MLKELHVRNFALVEQLELSFFSGFSVLSGETGAGKSIIIDALGLLLGARASHEMVRTGAESAEVEGSFTVTETVARQLAEWGMDCDGELVIAREISVNGRNKCRLNGRLVTVGQLSELGPHLVEIVGQHDSQSLMDADSHLAYLDAFGGDAHSSLVDNLRHSYEQWLKVHTERNRLRKDDRERNRRIDLLRFQIDEIESAHLKAGEGERLRSERQRLANIDRLRQAVQLVYAVLSEGLEQQPPVLDPLGEADVELQKAASIDESLAQMSEMLSGAVIQIAEVNRSLWSYLDSMSDDPELLDQVEMRLELIDSLRRKYGDSIAEILDYCRTAQAELDKLENSIVRFEELEQEEQALYAKWLKVAKEVSAARHEIASALQERIEVELGDLNMKNTRFIVSFTETGQDKPTPNGLEMVEFMISPNLGEDIKPLARIASGGELSRLMLAIKAILVQADATPTVVFDEIDTGIGGRTALNLAQKLRSLGSSGQVICVTHLPVIASFGMHHYVVEKEARQGRTAVAVQKLTDQQRVAELTRMLGGSSESQSITTEHAKELLRRAYGS